MTGIITNKIIRDIAEKPEAGLSGPAGRYSIRPSAAGRINRFGQDLIIKTALSKYVLASVVMETPDWSGLK